MLNNKNKSIPTPPYKINNYEINTKVLSWGEDLGEGSACRVKINESTTLSPSPSPSERVANAFTLAEVLITLVIIGVIAAITVPTVITKYQDAERQAKFKKAYSTLYQAIRKTNSDMGYIVHCYYVNGSSNSTECLQFFEQLRKNLNIIKTCKNSGYAGGCMPEYKGQEKLYIENHPDWTEEQATTAANRSCAGNFGTSGLKSRTAYVLGDGTILFAYEESWSPIFGVDTNGKRGPNKWGYDVFAFTLTKNRNEPYKLSFDGCSMVEKGGKTGFEMLQSSYQK